MKAGLRQLILVVLIVGLAGAMGVLAHAAASRPDPEVERFLDAPGAIAQAAERLRSLHRTDPNNVKAPLVAQAEVFALYLDPPKPAAPKAKPALARPRAPRPSVRPTASTPKFTLLGISYYRSCPGESRALIQEAEGEPQWVRQGTQVGHLIVEDIRRRTIVYRDGEQTREMAIAVGTAPSTPGGRAPRRVESPPIGIAQDRRAPTADRLPPSSVAKVSPAAMQETMPAPPRATTPSRRPLPRRAVGRR